MVATVTPMREATDIIRQAGGEALRFCYQCGLCSGTCPWNLTRSFLVRRMIRQAQMGVLDFEGEDVWLCATCGACTQRCPRGVSVIDIMRAMRRLMVEAGSVPRSLQGAMSSLAMEGNPWLGGRAARANWAKATTVKAFTKGMEVLYFPCCTLAYDPGATKVACATVNILQKAGVDFGILGLQENCCGESVRKAGNESLFHRLAESNIKTFRENGVRKIVTTSPHCYYTFKTEYPELGGRFEVMHYTQYLGELINEGRLKFTKEVRKKVVYQDPCYLGRHSGLYDEPRQVLSSIPGLELVEFPNTRENSLCCGGGGGRIWMETKKGERFSDIRVEQAVNTGAEIIATACCYCMLNFKDSVATVPRADGMEVQDISQLVCEAV